MVEDQIRSRGVLDPDVLRVMGEVPRHVFVPAGLAEVAYADEPLPIGEGQTISQPYIVAFMSEVLGLSRTDRVLEIGTGSGYQTAVLAELAGRVYSVELKAGLSRRAREVLERLGYKNIEFRVGDGSLGWPEESPFQAVIVTAAAPVIPEALEAQLAEGGRMIVPVGDERQELVLVRRKAGRLERETLFPVRFVPLVTGGE